VFVKIAQVDVMTDSTLLVQDKEIDVILVTDQEFSIEKEEPAQHAQEELNQISTTLLV
jgi:hypothetical protein